VIWLAPIPQVSRIRNRECRAVPAFADRRCLRRISGILGCMLVVRPAPKDLPAVLVMWKGLLGGVVGGYLAALRAPLAADATPAR
jgi:hypothetical protein